MHMDSELVFHEAVYRANSDDVVTLRFLSNYHIERESYSEARKFLGQLCHISRRNADVWISLCICCVLAGDPQQGEFAMIEGN